MPDLTIVAFAGSLRRASFNRGLVRAAVTVAPRGVRIEVLDLRPIPMFDQDLEDLGEPAAVAAFKQAIGRADALLVATPEYNHGMPGLLKNALDWASRPRASSPLIDKPVAIMGASSGRGSSARAQAQLRESFVFTGACVMPQPEVLVGQAASLFDADGELIDATTRDAVAELVAALVAWTDRLRLEPAA